MKVPYLNKKIKSDYNEYFHAYQHQVKQSFDEHEKKSDSYLVFKSIYPLFVFLESFRNEKCYIDPTAQIELDEYLSQGMITDALMKAREASYNLEKNVFKKIASLKRNFTPYIEELHSDAVVLLNNYYLNNYRGCFIAARCILEDLYRHIYFKDHKQEYFAINNGDEEHTIGLRPAYFRDYLTRTSFLSGFKSVDRNYLKINSANSTNIFKWNNDLYSHTSTYVHASNANIMSKFIQCSDFVFDKKKSDDLIKLLNDIIEISIVFLVCSHFDFFVKLNDYEKSLILGGIPSSSKANFRSLINV